MWSLAVVIGIWMSFLVANPDGASGQPIMANCTIVENSGVGAIYGTIILSQTVGQNLSIMINLDGFHLTSGITLHGFHVHVTGNLSAQCLAAGLHYNPFNETHGGPQDKIRHFGDWGNIDVNPDGTISTTITDDVALVYGPYSIIGHAIVVHALTDDLGRGNNSESLITGNAGARLGCCTITAIGPSGGGNGTSGNGTAGGTGTAGGKGTGGTGTGGTSTPTAMLLYTLMLALFLCTAFHDNLNLYKHL